jgi:hypothetical protein
MADILEEPLGAVQVYCYDVVGVAACGGIGSRDERGRRGC